ncbi:hypothetical protein [Streptomyces sp. NPDC006879]|uniref:hypothetical protein n=1 Tax=Streptomyces sp. NPDC006879 TaxID=3364767 RepID=UPI003673FF33
MALPHQPGPVTDPRLHARTEATRLLCAGVHLDQEFRDRVLEELVEHEERPVAPSLGVDAASVLAHAVLARNRELIASAAVLALWIMFFLLGTPSSSDLTTSTDRSSGSSSFGSSEPTAPDLDLGAPVLYLGCCVLFWLSRAARAWLRERPRNRLVRYLIRYLMLLTPMAFLFYFLSVTDHISNGEGRAWLDLIFPVLLALPGWWRRDQLQRLARTGLSRSVFRTAPQVEVPDNGRYQRISRAIVREQHSLLNIYDPFEPFLGAGEPHKPWSFAIELKRSKQGPQGAATLTGRDVVDLIRPRLEALRVSAVDGQSRDRLRSLEVDEFVYVPGGVHRAEVPRDAATVNEHLLTSVNEGGEGRRHFLRVRVGAWNEQVVLTVLVRVHTQGGMLVLEVVPHVLPPVRADFRALEDLEDPRRNTVARTVVRTLVDSPLALFSALSSLGRTIGSTYRTWLAAPRHSVSEGPKASVRELGSAAGLSLFQEMDVSRYLKTIQDRIASGTREALRVKGFETDEFQQQIINVSEGSVFIGEMSGGAVATGKDAYAVNNGGSRA